VDSDSDAQSSAADHDSVKVKAEVSAFAATVHRVGLVKGNALMIYEGPSQLAELLTLTVGELLARAEHAYRVLLDDGVLPPPFDGRRDAG
jgi:hypothetical protein